ncbi:MAG TPA: YihY/virulence factor BrkB family protein [Thermoanaerobaculia bacterium]|nr:YihY/virulence factor BrkB family protein [Thermoanaerobaculia bacterium]
MHTKSIFSLLKESFKEWQEDEALQLGAALAYYTIFSIAPMLLVVIGIAGLAFGREAVQGQIVGQLQGLVGRDGAEAIQTMIANAGRHEGGLLATIIAFVTILFGATGVFTQLQTTLNHIWDVKPKPNQGIKGLLRARAAAFGMILGIGFLLLVSLVISAGLAAMDNYMVGLLPGAEFILRALNLVVSFAVVTLLFAMIYRFLPDVKIEWRDVMFGAAVTAVLFTIGKFLIGLYLGNSSVSSVYGAAGSLVIVLLWAYYSSQILFFGAELTQVWARHRGSHIVPDKHAIPAERKMSLPSQTNKEGTDKTPTRPPGQEERGKGKGRDRARDEDLVGTERRRR